MMQQQSEIFVEMIDSITMDVSYMRSSRQDLVNTPSSENTYNGS